MTLEPVSVALKFGFVVVLYLFLLWIARSALRDLSSSRGGGAAAVAPEGTGLHSASTPFHDAAAARLVVERAPGHRPGRERGESHPGRDESAGWSVVGRYAGHQPARRQRFGASRLG